MTSTASYFNSTYGTTYIHTTGLRFLTADPTHLSLAGTVCSLGPIVARG